MKDVELNIKQIASSLEGAEIFSGLTRSEIASLCAVAQIREFEAGETIIRQGDVADCFYYIIEGLVDVYIQGKKRLHYIHSIEAREIFGEMALIYDTPRTATVKARTKVTVAIMSKVAFNQFLVWSGDAGIKVLKIINKRIISAETKAAKKIIQVLDSSLYSVLKLTEVRESYHSAHANRIREYTRVLALKYKENNQFDLSLDDEFMDMLYKVAPLYDIGKVTIKEEILLKPTPLTDAERKIINTHAKAGAEAFDRARSEIGLSTFLDMAVDVTAYHHERWDGKGYPEGLKEGEIPLSARLVAIADVYDALTSDRPYRKAFTHEKAWKMISDDKGHFDPALLEMLSFLEESFKNIKSMFSE
ncbi:MAG: cyclic nucleotide-binding domain-containing protein [Candidatus Coatesbacteria bacterium]|nr:cyclic nucleotide-binding domain-containing protein [Candidatus Coatesbacteria bacterium]